MPAANDPHAAFIVAAVSPLDAGHASGTLDRADALLLAHPDIATTSIHAAAILGDDAGVRRWLQINAGNATSKGGPHEWDALTHLCFSRYLRLDRARSNSFVRAATALLDAGASANTGWLERNHQPQPEWESAIYGAAGVARHRELTRLLLSRGADPNDEETPYHAPETHDNAALKELVASGKLTDESLTTMLLRKADWHDADGITWLLAQGANPNHFTRWGRTALHQAIQRDNDFAIIKVLLEHGADPSKIALPTRGAHTTASGTSAVALAARRGRGDILELFEQRGLPIELDRFDMLLAACARDDPKAIVAIATDEPDVVRQLRADGGRPLAEFSGVGNVNGVRHLLDLGVPITALYEEGDGYYSIARNSMAIHVAAWRARHATLRLLVERGSPIDKRDGTGRTPLALAVRACVDSYWSNRRSPESVRVLLDAGASAADGGVVFPSGYSEVDDMLRMRRA